MIPNRTPAGANLWLSKTQLEIFGCTSYFTEKRVGVAHGKNLCILQLNVGFSVVHGDFCWCTGLVQQEMEEAPAIKKPAAKAGRKYLPIPGEVSPRRNISHRRTILLAVKSMFAKNHRYIHRHVEWLRIAHFMFCCSQDI